LPRSVVRDVQHRFEVCILLESHAIACAAQSETRDLRAAHAILTRLNQAMQLGDRAAWEGLDLEFHRALVAQSGNPVVAAMHRELQDVHLSVHDPRMLWLLQSQHRKILSCVEAGQVEESVALVRAHLAGVRDEVLAGLRATPQPSASR
jgi:DNA-binding GntR family transcriptional regulator